MPDTPTLRFYMLHIDTSHFEFRAFGRTPEEAKSLMREAWSTHCRQTGAVATWLETDIEDSEPQLITVPSMWRDRSEMK